jgi:prepilin-type N-terminal cleavage/methylation domain-containing protein
MLKRNYTNRAKGFTLVELLLVIAILGTLTAIAIPSFLGQRKRARIIGDAKANAQVIRMALESRKADMGVYGVEGNPILYKADTDSTNRPNPDIIPTFQPKGNTQMDFEITIKQDGLAFDINVYYPSGSKKLVLTGTQNGEFEVVK